MKIAHKSDYAERRRSEYPPTGDQLDTLWKFIASLPAASLPTETAAMLGKVTAVKQKLPKG